MASVSEEGTNVGFDVLRPWVTQERSECSELIITFPGNRCEAVACIKTVTYLVVGDLVFMATCAIFKIRFM
jgi:hypothetical protein